VHGADAGGGKPAEWATCGRPEVQGEEGRQLLSARPGFWVAPRRLCRTIVQQQSAATNTLRGKRSHKQKGRVSSGATPPPPKKRGGSSEDSNEGIDWRGTLKNRKGHSAANNNITSRTLEPNPPSKEEHQTAKTGANINGALWRLLAQGQLQRSLPVPV